MILDRLAATASQVPPVVLAHYYETFKDIQHVEKHSEMLRQVGFYYWPATAEEFVREFIAFFSPSARRSTRKQQALKLLSQAAQVFLNGTPINRG